MTISRFILSSISLFLLLAVMAPSQASAAETYSFRTARKASDVDQVQLRLEVGGDLLDVVDNETKPVKMSVVCDQQYHEKTLDISPTAARSIRYYDKVDAVIKIANHGLKPALRPERCLIGADYDGRRLALFSPQGKLTREELDLIDVLGSSLVLDQLLPDEAVAVNDSWKLPHETVALLLGLDAVTKSDVQCTLTEVTDTLARFEMDGTAEGRFNDATTAIRLKAKYRFLRDYKRVDWLGLAFEEKRANGQVVDGLDVVVQLHLQIVPQAQSEQLTQAAIGNLPLRPTPDLLQLAYQSDSAKWRLTNDRDWFVYSNDTDHAVLRLVEDGAYLAQCLVSTLPNITPGKQTTLAEFQNDIRQALGERLAEFARAEQWGNAADYQVSRVVAYGQEDEKPIQWNYFLVIDKHGHRAAFSFAIERQHVTQFGDADKELVNSFRFLDAKVASKGP